MKFPYEFVDQMLQDEENGQVALQLYSYSGKLDRENLMEFCTGKNEEFPDASKYTMMIFDERENAFFSAKPLPYPNLGKESEKHIRAIYIYNPAEQSGNLDILAAR